MLNKRTQILLEKDLWNRIIKLAKSQNISAGEFIRRAVAEYLDKKKELISKENPAPFKGFFKRKS